MLKTEGNIHYMHAYISVMGYLSTHYFISGIFYAIIDLLRFAEEVCLPHRPVRFNRRCVVLFVHPSGFEKLSLYSFRAAGYRSLTGNL